MKIYLVIVLLLATIWDGFTTVYGTIQVLGNGPFQILASLLFSGLILAFVLNTRRIIKWRSDFIGAIAKFFWVIALCYDFYTSWIGNEDLIVQGNAKAVAIIILIGLTLLVIASPILLSTMRRGSATGNERETLPRDVEVTGI